MRVVSKFLTADVRIVRVTLAGRKMVVEGLVKEFMPMTVEMSPADARQMVIAFAQPLRRWLAHRLPGRFGAALAVPPVEATTGS